MHFAEGTLWRALLAWQAAAWRAKEDKDVLLKQTFSAWHSCSKRRAQVLAAYTATARRWANRCTAAAWSAWVEVAAMKAEARNKVRFSKDIVHCVWLSMWIRSHCICDGIAL